MRRFALALLCLLVAMSLAPWSWSQTATYAYQSPLVIFITVTTSNGFHISGSSAAFHVLTWNNTGTVTTCQIQADGSADGITWGNGDVIASTLCTSNGTVTSVSDVVNYIRINITAISGAGATVSARLTGYINNPVSASGTVTHTGGALANNAVVLGAGGGDTKVSTGITSNGASELDVGVSGTNGSVGWNGSTSGKATCTAPAVAGTAANQLVCTNDFLVSANGVDSSVSYGGANTAGTGLNIGSPTSLTLNTSNTERLFVSSGGILFNAPACDFNTGNNCFTFAGGLISTTGSGNPIFKPSNNVAILTSDFTDSNASGLQVITGLAITFPAIAKNYSFHCSLSYSEATPIASDQFGVASLTTAPTNLKAQAHVTTTEGAAAAQTTGNSGNITTTTPTSIVTFTPVGTGEKPVEIDGAIEVAGGGVSILQIYVTNGTAADVIVIKRGSYCRAF